MSTGGDEENGEKIEIILKNNQAQITKTNKMNTSEFRYADFQTTPPPIIKGFE